jgi:hypothetical protein
VNSVWAVAQIHLCFDKLSMSGKVMRFQHITVRPEPVEGQTVGLGNSPCRRDTIGVQSLRKLIITG